MHVEIVPGAVAQLDAARWLEAVDSRHRADPPARPGDHVAESSSFRLRSLASPSVDQVWHSLSAAAREVCTAQLGDRVLVDVDECWARRQWAPGDAPPRHHPHTWHQDGALRFDFLATALDDGRHDRGCLPAAGAAAGAGAGDREGDGGALLEMVTIWIALTACGTTAPGLELVAEPIGELLGLSRLTDAAVDGRWAVDQRSRPVLGPGDAVVFTGDVLHRTYASATMTATRTSIELRCFAAVPGRLADDRFVQVAPDADPGRDLSRRAARDR